MAIKKHVVNKQAAVLLLTALLIFLDQLLKWLVVSQMKPFDTTALISGVLSITYLQNTGAAFSLFTGNSLVLAVVTFAILAVVLYIVLAKKTTKTSILVCLSMIMAGGIGNLMDRLFRGFVVDYIDLKIWPFDHFAVFNFADCLVVVGTFALLILILASEFSRSRKEREGQSK